MGSSRRLSAVDTARLRMEEADNAVDVTSILELEGPFPEQPLRALIEERLLVIERFQERVAAARSTTCSPRR